MVTDDFKKILKEISILNDKLDNIDDTLEDHTRRLEAVAGDTEQLLNEKLMKSRSI